MVNGKQHPAALPTVLALRNSANILRGGSPFPVELLLWRHHLCENLGFENEQKQARSLPFYPTFQSVKHSKPMSPSHSQKIQIHFSTHLALLDPHVDPGSPLAPQLLHQHSWHGPHTCVLGIPSRTAPGGSHGLPHPQHRKKATVGQDGSTTPLSQQSHPSSTVPSTSAREPKIPRLRRSSPLPNVKEL